MKYLPRDVVSPVDLFDSEMDPRLPAGTRVNSYEAYPEVVKPLQLTAVTVPNDHGVRRQLRDLGLTEIDPPWLLTSRTHQGRLFVNLSWVLYMADRLPGADAGELERQLFGQHIPVAIPRPAVSAGERWLIRLNLPRFITMLGLSMLTSKRRMEKHVALRRTMALDELTNLQLDDLIEQYQYHIMDTGDWNTRGTLAGVILISLLGRLVGPDKARHIIHILGDVGEVESAAPALRIRETAQAARRRNPGLAPLLKTAKDRWETLAEQDHQAYQALQNVIDRYGYRSVAEFVIDARSWQEDPTPVMDAFVGLLAGQENDGKKAGDNQRGARKALLAGESPWRRWLINRTIDLAHLGARTRERTKGVLILRVDMMRQLSREISRRLVAAGRLDKTDDLYCLTIDEVRPALRGEDNGDLGPIAAVRRQEVERLQALPEPSEVIMGREPVSLPRLAEDGEALVLTGLGVSGTAVEGRARVVKNTDALDDFEPDEILIAQYTDAGWTPYFTMASAVVVETGGLLTHTSTVARELGLPAVVNVRDCTSLIHTGDLLAVDPLNGEVRILERAGQDSPGDAVASVQ